MTTVLPSSGMWTGKDWTWILVSYALGCITAGYYWVRLRLGRDIREWGSGNVGARNVGRALGPTGFLVTFGVDFTKGIVAILGARGLGLETSAVIASGMAVILGHLWPMQLRFRGGKGISTSMGVILAYDPILVGLMLMIFLPAYAVSRQFTLVGLFAFATVPLAAFLCGRSNESVVLLSLVAGFVLWAHRGNIREEIARVFPGRPVKDAECSDPGGSNQDEV